MNVMDKAKIDSTFPLYLFFFFSGAAGLAYEVFWTKLLGFSFGHTVYAVTTVLAAFMGGLALGSYLFGKLADRVGRPLHLYGYLELAIGLYCLAVPGILSLSRNGYLSLYPFLIDRPFTKTIVQFAVALLVLIVPTTLMGGTLPAIARGMVISREQVGKKIAFLYGTNTMGAALGAFLAGYWLLPAIGNRATNYLAVTANLMIGIGVLFLYRGGRSIAPVKEKKDFTPGKRSPLEIVLLWGFALSGAVAMSYQIAWVRVLVLVIGSSTYAFSSILVTFLVGIALGSYIFPKIKKGETPRFFAGLQVGIGLAAFFLIPFFNVLPRLFLILFRGYGGTYGYIQFVQFFIVSLVVIVPTTLMGMTFPCLSGILTRSLKRLGSDVGRFYAYNTVGAISGSVLTGFILIPYLGAQKTLSLGIGINLLVAVAIFAILYPPRRKLIFSGLAVALIVLVFVPSWNRRMMTAGVSIHPESYLLPEKEENKRSVLIKFGEFEMLYFREGISSTVAVTRNQKGEKFLSINGKTDASTNVLDLETFIKTAYIPMTLHQAPKKVAIIGHGSGITTGVASLFQGVESIHVIELEPVVIKASRYFDQENFKVLDNPMIKLIIDDGRSYIEGSRTPLDVIISEPSNPWIAGIANLFTVEFIEKAKELLAPGGVYCQWVQGYNMRLDDIKMVVQTFLKVFPGATLWEASPADYLLIGRKEDASTRDFNEILATVEKNTRFRELFQTYGGRPVEELITSYRLGPGELMKFAGDSPLNTDDLNLLAFQAPKNLYLPQRSEIDSELFENKITSHPPFISTAFFDTAEAFLYFGSYLLYRGRIQNADWMLDRVPPRVPFLENWKSSTPSDAAEIAENFDGEPRLPLFPRLGSFRPEEGQKDNLKLWSVYSKYLTRMSGTVKGSGRLGSNGLVLNSIEKIDSVGFFTPLVVKPSTTYSVKFWMKSEIGKDGETGVSIIEYDTRIDAGEQITQSVHNRHLIGGGDAIRIRGEAPWNEYSFALKTSPKTQMVHLLFVREGKPDQAPVVFDDISIRESH